MYKHHAVRLILTIPLLPQSQRVRLTAPQAGILARYIADSIIYITRTGSKSWENRIITHKKIHICI